MYKLSIPQDSGIVSAARSDVKNAYSLALLKMVTLNSKMTHFQVIMKHSWFHGDCQNVTVLIAWALYYVLVSHGLPTLKKYVVFTFSLPLMVLMQQIIPHLPHFSYHKLPKLGGGLGTRG